MQPVGAGLHALTCLLHVQGVQGEAAAALRKVLPPEMMLDLRMGSQAALLAMADAFPGHASVRHAELERFRQSVHDVSAPLHLQLAWLVCSRVASVLHAELMRHCQPADNVSGPCSFWLA